MIRPLFLGASRHAAIRFNTISDLSLPTIKTQMEKKGFVVLEAADSKETTLQKIGNLFGYAQKHVRNGKTGITEVVGKASADKNGSQVISKEVFFPHTDGAYLNGMTNDKTGRLWRVGPPRFIFLQCEKAAESGGDTTLVDGEKIFKSMLIHDRWLLPILLQHGSVTMMRGTHLVMDVPVFQRMTNGNYSVRFSYDRDLIPPIRHSKHFSFFNKKYIENPAFTTQWKLTKNQILCVDNLRMLHGRTAFEGERFLRRLWVYDDYKNLFDALSSSNETTTYFESEPSSQNPLENFRAYERIDSPIKPLLTIDAGIHLNNFQKRMAIFCTYFSNIRGQAS